MDEKLKVGIVCFSSMGGSGVMATELGKLLAEKGHQIHFIGHSLPFRLDKFSSNIFFHETEIIDYPVFKYPPYDLALANKIAQIAKAEQLNIIHVHYAMPHAICAFLAKQIVGDHLKIVTTLHGTDITILGRDEILKDLLYLAIKKSDAITAVSKDLIREARILFDNMRDIDLTYNFVDERLYYPRNGDQLRTELAIGKAQVLLHVSNFRPVKRVMDVVDIFFLVNQKIPSTRLVLVGEGPEMSKLQTRLHELKLDTRVHFLWKQPDIPPIMSLADVLLLPSEKESFGLVALEAMACGVPTVGSTAGGIPELVIHGETGFLAPIADTKTMAEYTIQLLTDKSLMQQIKRQCLIRARTEFNSEKIVTQYEQIYYRLLNR
jgi:N-acetyl-alpha-D-glucosaminyl L-malate synthase BshA